MDYTIYICGFAKKLMRVSNESVLWSSTDGLGFCNFSNALELGQMHNIAFSASRSRGAAEDDTPSWDVYARDAICRRCVAHEMMHSRR